MSPKSKVNSDTAAEDLVDALDRYDEAGHMNESLREEVLRKRDNLSNAILKECRDNLSRALAVTKYDPLFTRATKSTELPKFQPSRLPEVREQVNGERDGVFVPSRSHY